ncbi:MAG: hypothetical protein ACU84Q_20045 [Gammaproteobacteria bacterium]
MTWAAMDGPNTASDPIQNEKTIDHIHESVVMIWKVTILGSAARGFLLESITAE